MHLYNTHKVLRVNIETHKHALDVSMQCCDVGIDGIISTLSNTPHVMCSVIYMCTNMCTVIVYTLGGIEGILHVPLMTPSIYTTTYKE